MKRAHACTGKITPPGLTVAIVRGYYHNPGASNDTRRTRRRVELKVVGRAALKSEHTSGVPPERNFFACDSRRVTSSSNESAGGRELFVKR